MKKCPYCAEEIQDEAIVCRYCGRDIREFEEWSKRNFDGSQLTQIQPVIIPTSSPEYISKVITYESESAMEIGIRRMEKAGWEVVSTSTINRGWDASKTCCLGVIFLPLALFGKKSNHYQVVFRKRLQTENEIRTNLRSNETKIIKSSKLDELIEFSSLLEEDLDNLNLQTENPAAKIVISQLEKKQIEILERIKILKIERIKSQRSQFNIVRPFSEDEESISSLINQIHDDIRLLESAPDDPYIKSELQNSKQLEEELTSHYKKIITEKVLNNLKGEKILKPFQETESELEDAIEIINSDISALKMHKEIPELNAVLRQRQKIGRELKIKIIKTKTRNWWDEIKQNKNKFRNFLIIIIGGIPLVTFIIWGSIFYLRQSDFSIIQNTSTPTITATITPTNTATITPTYTVTPVIRIADTQISLFSGPSENSIKIGEINAQEEITIKNINSGNNFVFIESETLLGWIKAEEIEIDLSNLNLPESEILIPTSTPSPTSTITPTNTPTKTPTLTPTKTLDLSQVPPSGDYCNSNDTRVVCVTGFAYKNRVGYSNAASNSRFIVFSIGVENLSRSDITVNPFDVTLVMKDGSSYEYSSETYSYWDRPFSGLTLAPGDQSSGGLVFYVPKSDSPAKIIYRGGWFEENLIIQIKP